MTALAACAPASPVPQPAQATPEGATEEPAAEATTAAPAAESRPGEYPRAETLILYMHNRNPNPQQMNMFVPNNAYAWHSSLGGSNQLWFVNSDAGRTEWWLATGFEYDEGYTGMTISLREGVKWSDGEDFTADDVVFTLDMISKNPTMSYGATIAEWVTAIEKVDDYTVHLAFKDVNPRFDLNIASTWGISMVPEHIWADQDPLAFTNWEPVHTGPYKIIKADVEEEVFERIDDWWGNDVFGQPAPKYVIWRYLAPETRIIEMSEHRLDAAYLGGPTDFLTVQERNPYAIAWFDEPPYQWIDPCPRYVVLNHRKAPWDDPLVRRALSRAIDREKIINVAYEGYGLTNDLMVPLYATHQPFMDAVADVLETYQPTKYDPAEAEALMEEAGFTKGADGVWTKGDTRASITLISGSWVPELLRIGQVTADGWNEIGIETTTKPQEGAAFNDPWSQKTFEALTGWMCQTWYDPYFMFEKYHSKYAVPEGDITGSNDAGYANPELDAIVDQLASRPYDLTDETTRQLYHDAMEILVRDTVVIPISQSMFTIAEDTYYWTGWATADDPYGVPGTWVPIFIFNLLKIRPSGNA
jgi:peptide/nickel transport system substrate-binding protein